jgi:hypothetical protein
LWAKNFYSPKAGWEKAFERMQLTENFNSGVLNTYALGVNVNEYKGNKRIQHGGSIGGFRSSLCTFPEEKLSIVVLTNFSRGNPGGNLAKIADMLLPDADKTVVAKSLQEMDYLSKSSSEDYVGNYWDADQKELRNIFWDNDSLYYGIPYESSTVLYPTKKHTFKVGKNGSTTVRFEGKDKYTLTMSNGITYNYQKFEPVKPEAINTSIYLGEYYSPELQTSYTIKEEAGKLIAYHPRHGEFPLLFIKKEAYQAGYPLGLIEIEMDKKGDVTGFRATNGRVRNLWFERK